jgi:hypothetical protein
MSEEKCGREDIMEKRRQKKGTIAAVLLMSLVLGLGLEVGYLQSGICEDALKECFDDWYNQAWGYVGTVYCVMGYAFCKKYINP